MPRLALVALLLLLGTGLFTAIRPVWTIDPDAGLYVGLARSLAAGDGYALDGVPHAKYPPGLPILLSLGIRASGPEGYATFHGLLVASLLLATGLAFVVSRQLGATPGAALAVAAATGLSQTFFDLAVQYVRTEPLFLALMLGALACLWRAQQPRAGFGSWLAAAACVAAAAGTRLAGISLLVVPALVLVRRGQPTRTRLGALLVVAAGLGLVLAWQNRAAGVAERFPGTADYGSEFLAAEARDLTKTVCVDLPRLDGPALVRRVTGNLEVLARAMAVLLTNVDRAGARLAVGALALSLVVLGLGWLGLRRDSSPPQRQAAAYVAATLALYLLWPFNQQERFYAPLLPLLLLAAGAGVLLLLRLAARAWDRPAARRGVLAAGAIVVALLAAQRSDHPLLLGRWSASYAALLALAAGAWLTACRLHHVPQPGPAAALLAAALLALPFAHRRLVEWPARVQAFDARRVQDPQPGALARVDVDARLERVAIFLRDHTPPDSVLMTDVPSILQPLSGRRCIPFVYRRAPPAVLPGDADLVFYTRELPDATAAMDAVAPTLDVVLQLEPIELDGRLVTPAVHRAR